MLGGRSTAGAGAGSLGSAETRILSAKAQSRADDDIQSFADLCCPVPWTSQNAGLVTGPNAVELANSSDPAASLAIDLFGYIPKRICCKLPRCLSKQLRKKRKFLFGTERR